MKIIIISLLTVFVLFSCQSEMDFEPEFSNNWGTEKMLSEDEKSLFEKLYTPFGKDGLYPSCTAFDPGIELKYLFATGDLMFSHYPKLKSFAGQLLAIKDYSLKFGKDPKMAGNASGYYVPYKRYVILKGLNEINEINLMHEFLHAVQETLLCRDMSLSQERNIEYEVYVAQDILNCIRHGSIKPKEALGKPSGLMGDYEYVDKIQYLIYQPNRREEIKKYYNTWIKTWYKYSGPVVDNYDPKLLYMVLDCL